MAKDLYMLQRQILVCTFVSEALFLFLFQPPLNLALVLSTVLNFISKEKTVMTCFYFRYSRSDVAV